MNINKKISKYNFSSRNGNNIKYIVLHYTGNKGDTAYNNVVYFSGGDRNASAHYFVDDISIWQSVEDSNSAWSVGDGYGTYGITNANSISIEMCCNSSGNVSDSTESNAIELVKYLQSKYSVSNNYVVRHYDASRKVCPNWADNNWTRWNSFKKKLEGVEAKKEENYSMYLFSKNWYVKKYKDVANSTTYKDNPYSHYEKYGKAEGRQPLPPVPLEFSEKAYLELNKDVATAVKKGTYTSGLHHYLMYGFNEAHRRVCYEDTDEAIKKRVADLELKLEEIKKIADSEIIDVVYTSV